MAHRFRARLEGSEDSSAAYVLVPSATMHAFGGRIRVPVRVTISGVTWRTTIASMGTGPVIGVSAAVRKAAGIQRGDRIALEVEVDEQPRVVSVPTDLAGAMTPAERRAFDAMPYTHRKEYAQWIDAAKKAETRSRRIEKTREKLRERIGSQPRKP